MFRYKALLIILIAGIFGCQSQKHTEIMNFSELTIAEIHNGYEKEIFNSEQLVRAYLDRIEDFDVEINSLTIINPDALSIAKELDKEHQKTKVLRPLHGIPIIVKDNINTNRIIISRNM